MRRTIFIYSFATIALIIFYSVGYAQNNENELFADVHTEIEDYLTKTGVPSIAVAVAKNGKVIWEESFGWANIEEKCKATPHTLYPLASITKNLTATALMVLVEQGLVSVHHPINKYLGHVQIRAYQGKAEDATIRRLLQHSSGLPLYYDAYYEHQLASKISKEETIRRYGILVNSPGRRYQYSSLGYGIIEYIIEQVSNKSYREFMKEDVFRPLGMSEAQLFNSFPSDSSVAIEYKTGNKPAMFAIGAVRGGGDIYCRVHDLIKYGMFHLKNHLGEQEPIISDSLIDMMQNDLDTNVEKNEYALGWRIENISKYRVISHNGGGLGSDTRLALVPSENLAVAVLANSRAGNSTSICDKIMKKLLPDFRRQNRWDKFAFLLKNKKKDDTNPSLAGEWSGNITTYKSLIPVKLIIQADGQVRMKKMDNIQSNSEWIIATKKIKLRDKSLELMFKRKILRLDQNRPERYLLMMLQYENGKLFGAANVGNSDELIYCVPSYIELTKTFSSESR